MLELVGGGADTGSGRSGVGMVLETWASAAGGAGAAGSAARGRSLAAATVGAPSSRGGSLVGLAGVDGVCAGAGSEAGGEPGRWLGRDGAAGAGTSASTLRFTTVIDSVRFGAADSTCCFSSPRTGSPAVCSGIGLTAG